MMHFSLKDLYGIITAALCLTGLWAILGWYKDTTMLFAMLGTTVGNRITKWLAWKYGQDD